MDRHAVLRTARDDDAGASGVAMAAWRGLAMTVRGSEIMSFPGTPPG